MHITLKIYGCTLFLNLVLPILIQAQTDATAAPPVPDGIVVLHDVVIGQGGGHDLHAEIAYPKNAAKAMPAIIYIHGGGWTEGTYKKSPIIEFAKAGFFGASIEYRMTKEAKWPAEIQDCKLGVRWLRANAATYQVDPNHIGSWGDSAGGHLSACLATMADVKEFEGDGGYSGVSSNVQAAVDFFGPIDFSDPKVWYNPHLLFDFSYDQNPQLWKSGSPLTYLKAGDAPIFIAHGNSDHIVPLANSVEFDAALTAAGVPHEFLIVQNADHGFRHPPGVESIPTYHEIHAAALAFLGKYLKTP